VAKKAVKTQGKHTLHTIYLSHSAPEARSHPLRHPGQAVRQGSGPIPTRAWVSSGDFRPHQGVGLAQGEFVLLLLLQDLLLPQRLVHLIVREHDRLVLLIKEPLVGLGKQLMRPGRTRMNF